MNICQRSGKFIYENRAVAETVLNKKRKVRSKHKHDNRRFKAKLDVKQTVVYKCPFCNQYHLAGK